MNGQTQNLLRKIMGIGLSALALVVTGVALIPGSVSARHEICRFEDEEGQEWYYPCPHFQFIGLGGTGGGTDMPVPFELDRPIEDLLTGLEPWSIIPQELFPERTLSQGDVVTVMLVREYPDRDTTHVQPLAVESDLDIPVMYEIMIGENNAASEYDLGVLQEDAVGGTYTVLAIPQRVDSPEAFARALNSLSPDTVGVQRFRVENVASLDTAAARTYENSGRVAIPLTTHPALDAETDIELHLRKDGQAFPEASYPFQLGVYDTVVQSGPKLPPGEYEIDVLINGVLESTESLVVQ